MAFKLLFSPDRNKGDILLTVEKPRNFYKSETNDVLSRLPLPFANAFYDELRERIKETITLVPLASLNLSIQEIDKCLIDFV